MTDHIRDLDEVVRLAGLATPGEWTVRGDVDERRIHAPDTQSLGFRLEMRIAERVGGYARKLEDGSWDYSESEANASLIAGLVNYIRQHHAAIRRDAEAAEKWRAFERELPTTFAEASKILDAAIAKENGNE